MMKVFRATNLRADYKYLLIFQKGNHWAVRWESKALKPFLSKIDEEVFATIKASKAYCTMEIQNPKWGDEYPKLEWEEISQEDFENGRF